MTDIKIAERLWLSKEDNVFVDHCQLPQHQIDGIRFLYAQFKKKKPGVILNDPPGYGKTLQVVLFLSAVRRLLPAPALVLVKESELAHWRDHFQRWTQFIKDDVIFESSNPFVKRSVFVSTRAHAAALARRAWSVAVADDDCARPAADYKIWLTHVDMKENLYTFSSIYQWFCPKEAFDAKEFAANKKDPKDVVSKSLLLDAFLEDIVIRRKDFTPFKKPEAYSSLAIEPPRVSRKNKDATGTKIKRSKARIETEVQAPKLPRIDPPERNATITSKDYYKNKEMDVESFIKNEKPIESDSVEELMDFQTMMTKSDSNDFKDRNDYESVKINGDSKVNVTVKDDNTEGMHSEVNTADFQDAINDIVRHENENDSLSENIEVTEIETEKAEVKVADLQKNENDVDGDNIEMNEKFEDKNDSGICNATDIDVSVLEETKIETIQDVPIVNNGSKNDLDSKLSELEERTLNKFRGSILDSIF